MIDDVIARPMDGGVLLSHLDLFALENATDAGVKGGARKHGGDRVRQIQNLLKHRCHFLQRSNMHEQEVHPDH